MTPAETRSAILVDAARRIDRVQRCHPHALTLAAAAARQYALPYWTPGDLRRDGRRERNSFTQATRTFRTMTDWRQTRGQSREARIRAGLVRSDHFSAVAVGISYRLYGAGRPLRTDRDTYRAACNAAGRIYREAIHRAA